MEIKIRGGKGERGGQVEFVHGQSEAGRPLVSNIFVTRKIIEIKSSIDR